MKTKPLATELPRIDADTQSRVAINEDVVADYAEIIKESTDWPFPPLDVFHDGTDYYVADGFHRILGARRTKRGSIPCRVHVGTATDAHIFGMTANDRHGLRMTRADKRACVEWLLDNGGKLTQAAIAEKAGVGTRLVQVIVADRKPKFTPKAPTNGGENAHNANSPPHKGGDTAPNSPANGGEKAHGARCSGGNDTAPAEEAETDYFEPKPVKEKTEKAPTPPKQYPREHWFRQWENAIGPVCRLVDKIGEEVGERHDPHQEAAQEALKTATDQMAEWMGVKLDD